jgi:hypothetical protein
MIQKVKEEFCFSCEGLLLTPDEKLGPFCKLCFQKTKRRDPLMRAAIRSSAVVVVPLVCPHEERKHGNCRFKEPRYFSVIVLDKQLEATKITGPYTERGAEREAKRVRRGIDRRGR